MPSFSFIFRMMKHAILVTGLLSLMAVFVGCGTNLIDRPTPDDPLNSAVYRFNFIDSRTYAEMDTVIDAVNSVMEAEGFTRTRMDRKRAEAELVFRGSGDLPVTVKLKDFEYYTNIRIRYRMTGDEYQSRRLLEMVITEIGDVRR